MFIKCRHRTSIAMPPFPYTKYYFDEKIGDNVYTQIAYHFITEYIGNYQCGNGEFHILTLPPPDPENFVPFDKVDVRVILKWINDSVDVVSLQKKNTALLMEKMNEAGLQYDTFT